MKKQENQLWFVKPIFIGIALILIGYIAGYFAYHSNAPEIQQSGNSEAVGWCRNITFTIMALYPNQLDNYKHDIIANNPKCKNVFIKDKILQSDNLTEYSFVGDCIIYNPYARCIDYGGVGDVQLVSTFDYASTKQGVKE